MILKFGDAVGMVVCNTFFTKEDSKLITYQSGDNKRMIDYLMVKKTDRCLVKDVKVISSEECVPQHRMVIGRLVIPMKPQKKKIVKFVPKPRVWKLKDEETARLFTHEMAARNDEKLVRLIERIYDGSLVKFELEEVTTGWCKSDSELVTSPFQHICQEIRKCDQQLCTWS